jgi:hypothetical protein
VDGQKYRVTLSENKKPKSKETFIRVTLEHKGQKLTYDRVSFGYEESLQIWKPSGKTSTSKELFLVLVMTQGASASNTYIFKIKDSLGQLKLQHMKTEWSTQPSSVSEVHGGKNLEITVVRPDDSRGKGRPTEGQDKVVKLRFP